MARRPLPTSTGTVALRPVASPVDTYVQPPATNSLLQLASALSDFDPAMREVMVAHAEEQKAEDIKRADADHLLKNADGYAEAVRRGIKPAHESPAYVKRRKVLEGADIGRRLRGGLSAAWDAWEGKNTADDAATDAFVTDYIRRNIGTEDPDILAGAIPSIDDTIGAIHGRQTQYLSQQEHDRAIRSERSNVNAILDDADEAGIASGQGANHSASADAIERQRQAYIKTGGTGWDFDRNAMELIAAKAVELGDEKLFGFFDRTVPGETYTYGSTPEGSKLKAEAAQQLAVRARQAVVEGDRAAEAERKAREDAATRAAIDALVAGGKVPEEVLAAGEKANPRFRIDVGAWKEGLAKGARDPALVKQIKEEIVGGGGVKAVIRAMPSIGSGDDLSELITFAKSFESARPSVDDVLGSASAKKLMSILDDRTKAPGTYLNPITGTTNEGMEAQHDLTMMLSQWAMQNPDATSWERDEAVAKMGKLLLDRLTPDPKQRGVMNYDRDPEAVGGFANPYTDLAPETAKPAAQPEPKAPPEDDRSLYEQVMPKFLGGKDAPTAEGGPAPQDGSAAPATAPGPAADLSPEDQAFFGTFSPDQQAQFQAVAKSKGAPLSAVLEHARKKGIQPAPSGPTAPDGTPVDPVAYRPDEPDEGGADARPEFTREMADTLLQAVMADPDGSAPRTLTAQAPDPQAAHLLDLIGEHEAAGNYNAVFGNAGSTRDLSAMTLDQILGQQQAARRRGVASTAIGRYQFIYKTLRGLKEELGLTGQERFDSALQDRLGMALLERRGWNEFRAGKLSRRQFALRLSQEWAAMPDPRTGRSFYHSDGLNRAGTSTQAVYAAMGFTSGAYEPPKTMAAYAPTSPAVTAPTGGDIYANIPETERSQFRTWNSDPVANHEANLGSIDQTLAGVIRRAQELSGVRFVIGSGKRDDALQRKAVEWGWSKTHDSDHEHGGAVDLWGLDGNGAVTFDPETQRAIVKAMKTAARELGVDLDVGADWKSFKDNPHFALKGRKA